MVSYIQQLLRTIINELARWEFKDRGTRFEVLAEELNRLDPRDFPVDRQYAFIELRRRLRQLDKLYKQRVDYWEIHLGTWYALGRRVNELVGFLNATTTPPATEEQINIWKNELSNTHAGQHKLNQELNDTLSLCDELVAVLGTYGGQGSALNTKAFPFISDPDLRQIVERDYRSLIFELIYCHAWKSAVVMAGSILEAILYDQLTKDPGRISAAMASPKAPKKKGGIVKDITSDDREDEWTLSNLIEVSVDLRILPQARADAIDQVLRDYRNFVHPRKEIRAGHPCTEAEADLAKGALGAVINHLL